MTKSAYFLWLFVLMNTAVVSQGRNDLVTIESGIIEGSTSADGAIKIYKGIPYAAPPVGGLRWKAPQPIESWQGVRKCTAFSASPMQVAFSPFMFWSQEFFVPKEPIGEDCLYLNVWTGAKSLKEKRPVLIYLYGGAFISGGSACPIYDGEAMARKGVVFVTINYRVGVFGFLAHPDLSRESDYHASGNYALLDMIAALRWVQKNISAFGGDPENVTIAGQSAGSSAVSILAASPLAKGLFHRAIGQSGAKFHDSPVGRKMITLKAAEEEGINLAKLLNCSSLLEMRAKPADDILEIARGFASPVIDGYLIHASISDMYASGKQTDIPILIGWNADDLGTMPKPTTAAAFKGRIQKRFGDLSTVFFELYPSTTDAEATRSQSNMMRDEFFAIQMYAWAKAQSKTGRSKVFVYNFNRKLPAGSTEADFGAFHSGEIVYAYDNLHTLNRPWTETDHRIADAMSDYWVNFCRTGDPNGKALPRWQPYDSADESVLAIDSVIESKLLPDKKRLLFWESYFVRINKKK